MIAGLLVVLLAQAATPTPTPGPRPTPTPPINLLLAKPSSEAQPAPSSLGDVAKEDQAHACREPAQGNHQRQRQAAVEGVELTTSMAPSGPFGRAVPVRRPTPEEAMCRAYKTAVAHAAALESRGCTPHQRDPRLETAFYNTDDPAQRDGVDQAAWDKAIADLRVAQNELVQARNEPTRCSTRRGAMGPSPDGSAAWTSRHRLRRPGPRSGPSGS